MSNMVMQQETSAFHLMIRSLRAEVVDIDMEYILHTSLGAVRIQQIQTNSLTDFVIVKCSDEEIRRRSTHSMRQLSQRFLLRSERRKLQSIERLASSRVLQGSMI
jgi:hypothetical protein